MSNIITEFILFVESISGTELIGHMGPNYPDQKIPNTIDTSDTTIIYSDIDSKLYTYDDYQNIYHEYLKIGGTPLNGFNKENLNKVILFNSHHIS